MTAGGALAIGAALSSGGELGTAVQVALLGEGISKSRTPRMHEREGARLGLRYVYSLIDTECPHLAGRDIGTLIEAARICGLSGVNVTFPFKQSVIRCLDDLSDAARRIGAVNTVVFRGGAAIGHNTDHWGFAEGFRRTMGDARADTVLQLGAGGAGSAVARALIDLGVTDLVISDVDAAKARSLADVINAETGDVRARTITASEFRNVAVDGVVNTTPVGMAAHPGDPFAAGELSPEIWAADIVYFPLETAFLRRAAAAGCRCLSGRAMAVYQAVRAFEIFTGIEPDADSMGVTFDAFDR